jgi:hypothetical protein
MKKVRVIFATLIAVVAIGGMVVANTTNAKRATVYYFSGSTCTALALPSQFATSGSNPTTVIKNSDGSAIQLYSDASCQNTASVFFTP